MKRGLALVLLLALVWILVHERAPEESPGESVAESEAAPARAAAAPADAADPERIAEAVEPGAPFRFLDRLTGEPLPLTRCRLVAREGEVSWTTGEASAETQPPPAFRVEAGALLEDPAAVWEYEVPDVFGIPQTFHVPLAEAPPDAEGTVRLPWKSGVRGILAEAGTGRPLRGGAVRLVLPDPALEQSGWDRLMRRGVSPPVLLEDLAIRCLVLGLGRDGGGALLETPVGEDGSWSLAMPARAAAWVEARADGRASEDRKVELTPGVWSELRFALEARPTLFGTVFRQDGSPAGNAPVRIGIHYGGGPDVDLSLAERLGCTLGWSAEGFELNANTLVVTNREGRWSLEVPWAEAWSVSAVVGEEYGDSMGRRSDLDSQGLLRLDLSLKRSPREDAEVEVVWSDGTPLESGRVTIAIPDDPLARQFPERRIEEGRLTIPWREPGVTYGCFLLSPDLRDLQALTLPPGSRRLVLPIEQRPR